LPSTAPSIARNSSTDIAALARVEAVPSRRRTPAITSRTSSSTGEAKPAAVCRSTTPATRCAIVAGRNAARA